VRATDAVSKNDVIQGNNPRLTKALSDGPASFDGAYRVRDINNGRRVLCSTQDSPRLEGDNQGELVDRPHRAPLHACQGHKAVTAALPCQKKKEGE
jgi:hypothetical protein